LKIDIILIERKNLKVQNILIKEGNLFMALAKYMTRIVAVGNIDTIEYQGNIGDGMVKASINVGNNNKVPFTMFNKKSGDKPHTKAKDFNDMFKKGDLVYVTGQDSRNYNEDKDTYYEGVMGWDYRNASDDESTKWVFVYVMDVSEYNAEEKTAVLKFVNYKDEVSMFPVKLDKVELPEDFEVGARVKVKGEIFSGFEEDFYGDGQFTTYRNVMVAQVLHSAEEVKAEEGDGEEKKDENGLWS
jgi:hypothetical protein